MAHNGYFYPDDIVIEIVDGIRISRVGLELPAIWTDEAINASKKIDFLTGWEIARQAFRKNKIDNWYRETYSERWKENEKFRNWIDEGRTVSSFHKQR